MSVNMPKLDRRDRNDILEQLRALASGYVPEWRWDDRDPDVGVILAHLYAAMMENTVSKYNRSMYNHYLSFLNLLGTKLMPPSPAEGIISISVIEDSKGVYIKQGSAVYAAAGTPSGRVFYETTESVYAIDTQVKQIFFTSANRDSIVCGYRRDDQMDPIQLFGFDVYPELQRHILSFRDDAVFYSKDRIKLYLKITHAYSLKKRTFLQAFFSDPAQVVWEYHNGGTWYAMDRVTCTPEGICLEGTRGSHPVREDEEGEEKGILRCRLKRIPEEGVWLTDISWTAVGEGLCADSLSNSYSALNLTDFSPFGDRLSLFSEFNISNREAFCKAGAVIDIDFELEYFKQPIEQAGQMDDLTDYRSIMTAEDFPAVQEWDIQIERVLWEYWNGMGWARLFPDRRYEDFFTPASGGGRKRISFHCPPDMAGILLGASEGPFIRARIDKLTNMMSVSGNYIAPFVRTMTISYHYEGDTVVCREMVVESNMEVCNLTMPLDGNDPVITAGLCPNPAMYLCCSGPLTGGPLRVFWDIEDGIFQNPPSLRWEYYGMTINGTPGWKNIEVMDQTNHLTQSAIVTLVGKNDFVKTRLFGTEGYFIRLVDCDGCYDSVDSRKNPVILGIWPNTVPVIQQERPMPEYFYIARGEQNKQCSLSMGNLSGVSVWVNEQGSLSVKEEEQFLEDEQVISSRNAEGAITELWIPWQEVERLETEGSDARVYTVDYAEGCIRFGDGRHGRIPTDRKDESIMVKSVICDGNYGNIPPHAILGFTSKPDEVSWVTNHKKIHGGSDMETIDQASRRASGELLGMGRIVTMEDFQRAILTSNRNIYKVRCLAHVDRYNQPSLGMLSVAVLPRDYRQGGEMFGAVVRSARQIIAERASMLLTEGKHVDLFEVRYVEICVSAEIVISDYNSYHEIHQEIRQRLMDFLDPITGNFNHQGWNIGQLPSRELIYNRIKTVKNIKWIKSLHIFPYMMTQGGRQAVELRDVRQDAFTVPVFGEPEINLTVE